MKRAIYFVLMLLFVIGLVTSCKETEQGGPAQANSLKILPGDQRACLEFETPSGAVLGRVFYGKEKYKDFTITPNASMQKWILDSIPEGDYTFRVVTYDSDGKVSDPKGIKGVVYGNTYRSKLVERTLVDEEILSANKVKLIFEDDAGKESIGMRVTYFKISGSPDTIFIESTQNTVTIDDIDLDKKSYFCTVYKPTTDCIDVFTTPKRDVLEGMMKKFGKDGWSIAGVSDEDANHTATQLVDNRIDTYWLSQSTAMPHWVAIDMRAEKIFNGMSFVQVQLPGTIGFSKKFRIEISNDNATWENVFTGTLKATAYKQTVDFGKTVKARYFKLTILDGYISGSNEAQIAEIDLYNDERSSAENGIELPALKNAKVPFLGDGSNMFPAVGVGRMQKVKDWTHSSNARVSFDNTVKTLSPWAAPIWGLPTVNNGKIYQSMDLLPGIYVVQIAVGGLSSTGCCDMYGVVKAGSTLPDYGNVEIDTGVLGYDKLSDNTNMTRRITFTLAMQARVTIGFVYNIRDTYSTSQVPWSCININAVELSAK